MPYNIQPSSFPLSVCYCSDYTHTNIYIYTLLGIKSKPTTLLNWQVGASIIKKNTTIFSATIVFVCYHLHAFGPIKQRWILMENYMKQKLRQRSKAQEYSKNFYWQHLDFTKLHLYKYSFLIFYRRCFIRCIRQLFSGLKLKLNI